MRHTFVGWGDTTSVFASMACNASRLSVHAADRMFLGASREVKGVAACSNRNARSSFG